MLVPPEFQMKGRSHGVSNVVLAIFGTRFANSCACQHTSFSMCFTDKNHGFKEMCANDFTTIPLDHGTSLQDKELKFGEQFQFV